MQPRCGRTLHSSGWSDTIPGVGSLVVANAGSYSAELAVDSAGSVYYGTYNFGPNELRKFAAAQLAGAAASGTPLAWTDGAHLTDLEFGAGGIECDEQDNVVFTLNDFGNPGLLGVIRAGAVYTGTYRYDLLSGVTYFTTGVDAVGDVMDYSSLADAAYTTGGATLSAVPEPTTTALLGAGLLAGLLRRRRTRG